MADLLLSALIPCVLKKAADSLFQRIGEMWGINDQRERLYNTLLEIQAILPDAEEKANSNAAVKSWLLKLESAAYEADDLLDEFCYEELRQDAVRRGHKDGNVSAFFSLENPSLFRHKMSGKLKKVLGRLDGLVVQMGRFRFVHGQRVHVVNRIRTDSLLVESKVVGRDEDKEKVVQLLLQGRENDDLIVVPIVGMGGLGKTTLAQLVYNDPRVKEHFNLPLWVCVSEEDNIGQIVKLIIELVKGECNISCDNIELLQRRLRQEIRGKRYLLVLDDVWNENVDAWERLRAMLNCGDSGSAIIVTTRSGRVATIMGTAESYNLGCLGEEDSWSLFHKRAFSKGVKECQELVEIGRKMVQNCRGLPLAVNTLGSLMSYKLEVREWLDVLEESRIWEQRPAKDEVLPVLRLSYDHLPSYMKLCFTFCAIYPKDYEMEKEKLIQFWMENGFIPSDGSGSLEMKGNNIFNELVWRSFLQEIRQVGPVQIHYWTDQFAYQWEEHYFETKCKMHDLMHDLAQSIMGAKCLFTSEVPAQVNQSMINAHHISVRTIPVDINKVIDCFPSIRSLICSYHAVGASNVKNIGFDKSNSLRILELYVNPIANTIFTAGKIKHLRYLELSIYECTSLPEAISTLYLLQTLRLPHCWDLERLPEGMRYMNSLRHLYIEHCDNLRSMPEGLGQLNCLQILTTYIVGTDAGNGIRELNNLNNLHGQLHLYNLRVIKHAEDARQANLIAKQNLDDLALCWGMPKNYENIPESNAPEEMLCDPFEVLDALKPCTKLKVLKIKEYRGDEFPIWMIEYHILENLIELNIIECRECTRIPPVEKLPFLQNMELKHLDNLRNLCNSVFTSAEGGEDAWVTFPSLKKLILSEMPELCSWCEGENGSKSLLAFPELKALEVINCPKLTSMPIVPSLKSMSVKGNKDLSCFATALTTLHDLTLVSHGGNESLSFQPWESLNNLILGKYDNIVLVGAKEGEVSITQTKCRSLSFLAVSNIPLNTALWFWKCFTFLENLQIDGCDSLIYWPEEVFRSLNCLRYLFVDDCPNFLGSQLESPVGRSITEVLLPKLEHVSITTCPNLVEIPKCSTSIQKLGIARNPKLQYLPEWLGSIIALKELRIGRCESLNCLPLSIGGLASLEWLQIYDCPSMAYLPEGMEGLKTLKNLYIENCPKIRALPDGMLQQLKNIDEIFIEGCPHLERHFRKYGKYRRFISENQVTKFGDGRRSGILKDLALSFSSSQISCFSARS
ncbi:disease resistance protein RGA2-like [Carex rostrata]